MIQRRIPLLAVLGLTLLTAACGKKPAPEVAAPPPATRPTVDDSAEREARERAAREAEEARLREEAARLRASLEEMVFFDYDLADIRGDAQLILDVKAGLLRADPSIRLIIEGHADERGSTEYNIVLGLRRATAVRDYLTNFGLDAARFQTVSFGEERPLAQGQNEAAWARNRRVSFRVQGATSPPSTDRP